MAAAEREAFIDIEPDLRIRFRRSEAPPPVSYAITLEVFEAEDWTTARLWDNADDVDEHHEHLHTRKGGKQEPTILAFGSTNEAMAAAIEKAKLDAEKIVRQWRGDES
jgi:hypothetical protein